MTIFITGATGLLGQAMIARLEGRHRVVAAGKEHLDVTDAVQVNNAMALIKPTFVINCAAYTNVRKAETDIANCARLNDFGTANVAQACEAIDATMIHFSTDYVFDGLKGSAYTEEDLVGPVNTYGHSKLLSEERVKRMCKKHFIVRTSWLYGEHATNSVDRMIEGIARNRKLEYVNDQFGSPTYTGDLVKQVERLFWRKEYGIYHASGVGEASWYDVASSVAMFMKPYVTFFGVSPISTESLAENVKRPPRTSLMNKKLSDMNIMIMPHYLDSLKAYVEDTVKYRLRAGEQQ